MKTKTATTFSFFQTLLLGVALAMLAATMFAAPVLLTEEDIVNFWMSVL